MTESAPEIDAVVVGMVRLAEGLGYALPWANLLDACDGFASREAVREATHDLIDRDVLEASARGLRFALAEPRTSSASTPEEGS